MNSDTQIHSRALLVWLTISTWSARKYDRTVSAKVNREYNASSDAGRYNKFLLPGDAASYKTLAALASSIRAQHYQETLAWSDEGWRLLTTANYMRYTEWFRKKQAEFDSAKADFAYSYPGLKDSARALLGDLFQETDYPHPADIEKRFELRMEFAPLPAVGDVRVDLAADQVAVIEDSIKNRLNNAVELAVQDSWKRLYSVVAHVVDRLSDPTALFKNSLIDNAKDICDALQRLNVTDDPNLEAMRVRVLDEIVTASPDVLRENKIVRANVAEQAADIMSAMSAFYSEKEQA